MTNEALINLFVFSLLAGLILIGAEIFVPGGVLGVLGGLALIVAVATSYATFSPQTASYLTIAILLLIGIVVYLWIRYFPKTPIGRRMTLARKLISSAEVKAPLRDLIGRNGIADTDLRPSGFAVIDGERRDVVTSGEMVGKNTPIRVCEVRGNRIVVTADETTIPDKEQPPEQGSAPLDPGISD